MKRAITLLLVICLLFLFGGLTISGIAQEKVKLVFMTHTFKPFNDLNKKVIDMYTEEHPNVEITYSYVPHGDFDTKILTMFAAHKEPNMMWNYYPLMARLADAGLIEKAPDDAMKYMEKNLMPVTIKQAKYKGKLYGYPEPFVVLPIANTDIWEESGLSYPTSYPDWLEAQKKLTIRKEDGTLVQVGVSLANEGGGGWIQQHWSALLWGYGERYLTPDLKEAAFNTPDGVASLKDYKILAPIEVDWGAAFEKGKSATTFSGWYMRRYYEQYAPDIDFKALVAPRGTKTDEPIANCYYWLWVVSARPPKREREEAWKFFKFLASPEINALYDKIGHGMARHDSIQRYKEDPWMNTFLTNLKYSKRFPPTPVWMEIQRELDIQIERFLAGEISAEEALSLAEKRVNLVLARALVK